MAATKNNLNFSLDNRLWDGYIVIINKGERIKEMAKFKWRVSEAPTGQYRSFFHRAWPMAFVGEKVIAHMVCKDSYEPRNVRNGNHAEIEIHVADYREGPAFKWRCMKKRAATISEAKEIFQNFYDNNHGFFDE